MTCTFTIAGDSHLCFVKHFLATLFFTQTSNTGKFHTIWQHWIFFINIGQLWNRTLHYLATLKLVLYIPATLELFLHFLATLESNFALSGNS